MKRTSRKPSSLSESLQRHLNAYAIAASAAGVGMLALANPAEAKIVYTHADVFVFNNHGAFFLDLNHDGTPDFMFVGYQGRTGWTSSIQVTSLAIAPALRRNAIWQSAESTSAAAALRAEVRVGPEAPWITTTRLMGRVSSVSGLRHFIGPWEKGGKGVRNRYLGLKFEIKGKTHYGWARLDFYNPTDALLTGYAYETIANKPIVTGHIKGPDVITLEPGSLGALAAGAVQPHRKK